MPQQVTFGPFTLDAPNATLMREGTRVDLTPKAFDLLALLAGRPGQLVTKDEILDNVWGRRFVSESVVKTVVSELRAALADDARAPRFIETVSRRGYRLLAPAASAAPAAPVPQPPMAAEPIVAPGVIGRAESLAALQRAWADTLRGTRRVVFVAGEPGVGKSTLLTEFARAIDGGTIALGQCVEHYGAGEPYLPVLEALNTLCSDDAQVLPLVRQMAPTWLLQMPWHLNDADRAALQREVIGASQDRMLREMGMLLEQVTARTPLLLVLEDLHWSDPATVQLIDHLARRRGTSRMMVVASFRPAEVIASEHPMSNLRRELRLHRLCDEIPLDGFNRDQVAEFVATRLGGAAAAEALVDALERHTDGLPLFLASVLDEAVEQGLVRRGDDGQWRFPPGEAPILPLPDNLLGLVEKQVQRLPEATRALLEAAAIGAPEFDHLSLADALQAEDGAVREQLDGLVRRRLWLRAAGPRPFADGRVAMRYAFSHALFRHAFAHRLGAVARIELHRRLGLALEALHGDAAREIAGELVNHAQHSGDPARAAQWSLVAAQVALQRIAPHEALAAADRGLALLEPLPPGPARGPELGLLMARIGALMVTRGFSTPEVMPTVERVQGLIEALPLSSATAPLWHATWWALNNGGGWDRARHLAVRFAELGEGCPSLPARAAAMTIHGMETLFTNNFRDGIPALRRSLALQGGYAPADGAVRFVQDLRIECLANLIVALDACGRFDEAAEARAGIEALIAGGHVDPLSEAMGLWFMACAAQLRRDVPAMLALGRRAMALMAARDALPGAGPHNVSLGWARAMAGQGAELAEGLAQVELGIAHYERQGSLMGMSWHRAAQAEAHLAAGDLASARRHADTAVALGLSTQVSFMLAYVLHIDAKVCWAEGGGLAGAQPVWERAIANARETEAPLLELIATAGLAEALAAAGQPGAARERLAAALARIAPPASGAAGCPAVQQAGALLAALSP